MIKVKDRKLLLLPGDGIGPEVVREVKKIIEWFNKNKSLDFKIEEGLIGGASYDKHKNPITVFVSRLQNSHISITDEDDDLNNTEGLSPYNNGDVIKIKIIHPSKKKHSILKICYYLSL